MTDIDLPLLDDRVTSLPADIRADLAVRMSRDLFLFAKFVCGYKDMTEGCHAALCVFLDENPAQVKGAAMPRDTFKTSIGTIARNMQGVVQNRDRTRLIANENATNSERFLRAIRQHGESNKIFRALYSSVIPKDTRRIRWNDQELDFNRDVVRPEPTIDTIGITGAWTSRHYDDITFDDLISEEAIKSEKIMKDTIDRALKFRALMRKPGDEEADRSTLSLLFTRWAFHDVYSVFFKKVTMAKFVRGAVEDGEPIFPEHLSLRTLTQIRQEIGEYMFSCLYMNNPRNADVQDFNLDDLRFCDIDYERQLVVLLNRDGHEFRRYYFSQLDITATVDFAVAETTASDRNAISVVGTCPTGEMVSLASWAKRCTPVDLMTQIFFFHRLFMPRVWGMEAVAYQKAYKYFTKDYADREDLYLNVRDIKAPRGQGGKNKPHIRGLQPIAATGRLYIHPGQHTLRTEMSEYPLGEHDDALEALALQLQLMENQMSPKRWDKYKASERDLIASIENEQRLLKGLTPIDPEEVNLDYSPRPYTTVDLVA